MSFKHYMVEQQMSAFEECRVDRFLFETYDEAKEWMVETAKTTEENSVYKIEDKEILMSSISFIERGKAPINWFWELTKLDVPVDGEFNGDSLKVSMNEILPSEVLPDLNNPNDWQLLPPSLEYIIDKNGKEMIISDNPFAYIHEDEDKSFFLKKKIKGWKNLSESEQERIAKDYLLDIAEKKLYENWIPYMLPWRNEIVRDKRVVASIIMDR